MLCMTACLTIKFFAIVVFGAVEICMCLLVFAAHVDDLKSHKNLEFRLISIVYGLFRLFFMTFQMAYLFKKSNVSMFQFT